MNIEEFDFSIKEKAPGFAECILINRESKVRFGIIIRANGLPPNNWVFDRFLEDRKLQNFFVDIESQVVYDEVIVEKKEVFDEELKKVEKTVDETKILV